MVSMHFVFTPAHSQAIHAETHAFNYHWNCLQFCNAPALMCYSVTLLPPPSTKRTQHQTERHEEHTKPNTHQRCCTDEDASTTELNSSFIVLYLFDFTKRDKWMATKKERTQLQPVLLVLIFISYFNPYIPVAGIGWAHECLSGITWCLSTQWIFFYR